MIKVKLSQKIKKYQAKKLQKQGSKSSIIVIRGVVLNKPLKTLFKPIFIECTSLLDIEFGDKFLYFGGF